MAVHQPAGVALALALGVAIGYAVSSSAQGVASGQALRVGNIAPGYGISMKAYPQVEGPLLHMKDFYVLTPDGGNLVAEQATYNHQTHEIRLSGYVTVKMPSVEDHLRYTLQTAPKP